MLAVKVVLAEVVIGLVKGSVPGNAEGGVGDNLVDENDHGHDRD